MSDNYHAHTCTCTCMYSELLCVMMFGIVSTYVKIKTTCTIHNIGM